MESVQRRFEVAKQKDPDYGGVVMTKDDVEGGRHRRWVGGHWDEIGKHQLDFLVSAGLTPNMCFLDVGCGSLRAGIHLVDYLDPSNYYGIDINSTLIEAGYNTELSDSGRAKLPIENLAATDRFDSDFGVKFDMAIANSIFTHVSLNQVRLCLARLAPAMKSGGAFYGTFFEQPDDWPIDAAVGKPPKRRFQERNVYWYYRQDMVWAAERLPFDVTYIGDWGHARGQMMVQYTRS